MTVKLKGTYARILYRLDPVSLLCASFGMLVFGGIVTAVMG